MRLISRSGVCFAVLAIFFLPADFLHGQVTYTITGFTTNFFDHIPEVGPGESYVAEFDVDLSVSDSDADDPDRGTYENAILSSSIVFSGGYVSQVDFTGGTITILPEHGGGGIFLQNPGADSTFLVADVGEDFVSDALFSDISEQFFGDTTGSVESIVLIQEPNGSITSFSTAPDLGFGDPTSGPILLSVSLTAPVEVVIGDVNLDGATTFADIPPFVGVLFANGFQEEADCDRNGEVEFADIPGFVAAMSSN